MTTSKARQYYVSEETRAELSKIGGGNYSKGIRISAAYHERLIEALRELVMAEVTITHDPHEMFVRQHEAHQQARALMEEIEEAGK